MRLINYLNEDKLPEIVNIIKDKCKPFLKEWDGNYFLYRGIKKHFDYEVLQVRNDRKPKDMPLPLHNMFDNAFQKRFGWKARSNSVFCTGNQTITEEYGALFIVFPSGKYSYISSTEIEDLYVYFTDVETLDDERFYKYFDNNLSRDYSDFGDLYNNKKDDKSFMKAVELYINELVKTYKNNGLNKMIMQGNEIMIRCNEYIAVKYYSIDANQLRDELK